MKIQKTCKNCGASYETSSNNSLFCCAECRKESAVKDGKILGEDYVICQICNRAVVNVTGSHLRNHKGWTADMYRAKFPDAQVIGTKALELIRQGSINAGAQMKTEERRNQARENVLGEKNPMHRSKTTDEERRAISPFSPDFYLKRNPDLTLEEAQELANDKLKSHDIVSWNSKEYWIGKGLSEADAISKVSELQSTFSLEKCIAKYGEVEGKNVWLSRQEKWKASVYNENTHLGGGTSMIGEEIISMILEHVHNINPDEIALYGKNEKFIKTKDNKAFKYDLTFSNLNKIIEFNGDYWHCNPKIYGATYINRVKNMSAKDIWEYDKAKSEIAKHHGYDILHVWESEYRADPQKTLETCLKFIYDKNDIKEEKV